MMDKEELLMELETIKNDIEMGATRRRHDSSYMRPEILSAKKAQDMLRQAFLRIEKLIVVINKEPTK